MYVETLKLNITIAFYLQFLTPYSLEKIGGSPEPGITALP
jgi:hypothetical protein